MQDQSSRRNGVNRRGKLRVLVMTFRARLAVFCAAAQQAKGRANGACHIACYCCIRGGRASRRVHQQRLGRHESRDFAADVAREKLGFAGIKAARIRLPGKALDGYVCHLSHPV